ncbi:hypothetical protein F7230_06950 [Corynebacterium sp. 320]|uniref:hypothetical protein n=1 Tax=Corynebacterium TaxID=1716 RepID=UPI00125CD334|nr:MULTISPECIES: hypothetical protein [Corynebacterium]KAB1502747.1 hypothetical protein F7230_06950 [Corynebacterium sp. 320]KAB1550515.1 hypothetical protein F7232_09560 [Corynebacterium sp. 319]KAB1554757.1 hypothetical protein F7233_00265 [Corynebacterium sp. 321]KAB3526410.1 hypothetical protein F8354_06950 [Corynebacterium sp. 250]KAB3537753.1 hypothetical protein F8390_09855 [Corynebacterium sp. 366]
MTRRRKLTRWLPFIALSAVVALGLVIGAVYIWSSGPEKVPVPESDSATARTFVGISTETALPLNRADKNNLFWSAEDGSGGRVHSIAPTYFPSIERISDGFVAPDRDSIIIYDDKLNERQRFEVPELGAGLQSSSRVSNNGKYAAFSFHDSPAAGEVKTQIVVANSEESRTLDVPRDIDALTVCDDGTIRWIEFDPHDKKDEFGEGSLKVKTWGLGGEPTAIELAESLPSRPSSASLLPCGLEKGYILGHDADGKRLAFPVLEGEQGLHIGSPSTIVDVEYPSLSRFDVVQGDVFYSLDGESFLTATDLNTGKLIYKHQLDVKGPNPVSVTYDNGKAFVVARPTEFDNGQAILPVDLKNPECVGELIRLRGYNEIPKKAYVKRFGESFMVVMNVLPVDKDYTVRCS